MIATVPNPKDKTKKNKEKLANDARQEIANKKPHKILLDALKTGEIKGKPISGDKLVDIAFKLMGKYVPDVKSIESDTSSKVPAVRIINITGTKNENLKDITDNKEHAISGSQPDLVIVDIDKIQKVSDE